MKNEFENFQTVPQLTLEPFQEEPKPQFVKEEKPLVIGGRAACGRRVCGPD